MVLEILVGLAVFVVVGVGVAALLSIGRRRIGPPVEARWEYESENEKRIALEAWRRRKAAEAADNEKGVE